MAYITPSTDITDYDVKQFITANDARLATWSTAVDNELVAMAYQVGLVDDDISATVNPVIKEYLVAYYCYIVFRDNVGATNSDIPDQEKYFRKFEMYGIECNRLRKRCTKELIRNGTDNDAVSDINRAPVNVLLRV